VSVENALFLTDFGVYVDPETVGCIRNVGALDKMVDMLQRPNQLDEVRKQHVQLLILLESLHL
jgi:hypothetical protein